MKTLPVMQGPRKCAPTCSWYTIRGWRNEGTNQGKDGCGIQEVECPEGQGESLVGALPQVGCPWEGREQVREQQVSLGLGL